MKIVAINQGWLLIGLKFLNPVKIIILGKIKLTKSARRIQIFEINAKVGSEN